MCIQGYDLLKTSRFFKNICTIKLFNIQKKKKAAREIKTILWYYEDHKLSNSEKDKNGLCERNFFFFLKNDRFGTVAEKALKAARLTGCIVG